MKYDNQQPQASTSIKMLDMLTKTPGASGGLYGGVGGGLSGGNGGSGGGGDGALNALTTTCGSSINSTSTPSAADKVAGEKPLSIETAAAAIAGVSMKSCVTILRLDASRERARIRELTGMEVTIFSTLTPAIIPAS